MTLIDDSLSREAIELYRQGTFSLGQAARLAGVPLGDFIDLCGRLRVPVLWEPEGGLAADVDALEGYSQDGVPPTG